MTGERMPLARAIIANGNMDSDTVLFDIQVAYDLVPGVYDRDKLGPVRPPYPEMFMEFEADPDRDVISKSTQCCGFVVREQKLPDGLIDMHVTFVLMTKDGGVGSTGLTLTFHLDRLGNLLGDEEGDFEWGVDDGLVGGQELSDSDAEKAVDFLGQRMLPVLLTALSLINCRNVTTEPLGTIRIGRSGAQKRRGIPAQEVRYNTIILPGGGSQRVGSGSGAHHRATAVHRVRGHPKTFTAEAPLFGKYTGTYWWGWSLRGNPELGVVESDYVLGEDYKKGPVNL